MREEVTEIVLQGNAELAEAHGSIHDLKKELEGKSREMKQMTADHDADLEIMSDTMNGAEKKLQEKAQLVEKALERVETQASKERELSRILEEKEAELRKMVAMVEEKDAEKEEAMQYVVEQSEGMFSSMSEVILTLTLTLIGMFSSMSEVHAFKHPPTPVPMTHFSIRT